MGYRMRKRYYLILILILFVLTISSFVFIDYIQQMSVRFEIDLDTVGGGKSLDQHKYGAQ